MDDNKEKIIEKKYKRRVRYNGTHPKTYREKYKEHQPEKYADTIEKVIRKGSTPAGMHIPICVQEILDFLQIKPGQKGLDVTLGYGGHTLEMLSCLKGEGHHYALDIDPIEIVKTKKRLEEQGFGENILTIKQMNFEKIDELVKEVGPFDYILGDLGVSSMQIDDPERGFSYKTKGPLDLRLNPQKGYSAADRIKDITEKELEGMLIENADEPYAQKIAKAIILERKKKPILTTTDLQQIIEAALQGIPKEKQIEEIKKSCQRTFQALRIDVNNEYEVLDSFLKKLPNALNEGGRVAILTFHSGEDRLVKKSFKEFYKSGLYREIATEVIRPSKEEQFRNGRARSAKMRWAIKAKDKEISFHREE